MPLHLDRPLHRHTVDISAPPRHDAPRPLHFSYRFPRREAFVSLILGALGVSARIWLMVRTSGTTDIDTWERFAGQLRTNGLIETYRSVAEFNHPPLMGLWAMCAARIGTAMGLGFPFAFKLLSLAGDLLAAYIIFTQVRRAHGPSTAMASASMFLVNPVSVLVTGYHGNTDPLLACLCLWAAVLVSRRKPLLGGLVLGAAINVKLVPLVLVAPLLLSVRPIKGMVRLVAGLAVMSIPFWPPLVFVRAEFISHVVAYNSIPGMWGFPLIAGEFAAINHVHADTAVRAWFTDNARHAIMLGALLFALVARLRKWRPAIVTCGFGLTFALVLAPGFGFQYLVWPIPLLFVIDWKRAMATSIVGGVFLGALYLHFWTGTSPAFSGCSKWPTFGIVAGLCTWLSFAAWNMRLVQGLRRGSSGSPFRGLPIGAIRIAFR